MEKNFSISLEQELIYSGAYITLINLLSKNPNRNERILDKTEKNRRKPLNGLYFSLFFLN